MSERSIVEVVLWNSSYLGNLMSSQLALARAVRARFGLSTHFVLAPGAQDQGWHDELEAARTTWSVLPEQRRAWTAHLRRTVAEHRGTLVHAHFTAADLQSARVAHAAGIPCVWHVHTGFNGYPLRQRAKDLIKMRWVARRKVQRIVAVSPWLGELARRRGAPAARVRVIPNGIVLDRFATLPPRGEARARFGLDPDAVVVLALGWWPEVKGVDVLLDALEEIAARHPRMQALLVGEEAMEAFLARRAPRVPPWLRLSRFVEDAAWLFAAADVFVSASRHEGQSTAIGEAIACGLPVVMSDIPGTSGWRDAPGVEPFPSEDAGALAQRLADVLARPADARAASARTSRAWAWRHVGVDAWCRQLCDLYGELLRA